MTEPGRLRICMLSDYEGRRDEGVTNTAYHLAEQLSGGHTVSHLCLRPYPRLFSPSFWKRIRDLRPDIIHFVPGPTTKSFVIVKMLHAAYPPAKTIMSAAHPALGPLSAGLVPLLRPDLVLTQSPEGERLFAALRCRTRPLPAGVDTDRFIPASAETKRQLRLKYGFSGDDWIALHIGPLKTGRNVLALRRLVQDGIKVVVAGSLTVPADAGVRESLVESGCIVWHKYFENVAELYQLADCYIFPTIDRDNCVETPLSVLEAMSCNLPVLSTRFRALPHLFGEGQGLYFFSGEEPDLAAAVRRLRTGDTSSQAREKVLPYSWAKVGRMLEDIYREAVA